MIYEPRSSNDTYHDSRFDTNIHTPPTPAHAMSDTSSVIPQSPPASRHSLPTIPRLEITSFDEIPFSETFSCLFQRDDIDVCSKHVSLANPTNQYDIDMSYDIDHFHIKELVPEWEDDEIDEVIVMSPRFNHSSAKLSSIPEDRREADSAFRPAAVTIHDFEPMYPPASESWVRTSLCRRRGDTSRLYVLKSVHAGGRGTTGVWRERHVLGLISEMNAPFLPQVRWSFCDAEREYLVLDHHPGGTLHARIAAYDSPLDATTARIYASEVVEGLDWLHAAGIVHCALGPTNVVFDADGHVVLTGFGCTSVVDRSEDFGQVDDRECLPSPSSHCAKAGGPCSCGGRSELEGFACRAPEVRLGWRCDFKADVWGFGVVLYCMTVGKLPSVNLDVTATPNEHALSEPGTDSDVGDLISKCLERNPVMRPDIQDIKTHEYFAAVNWKDVEEKKCQVVPGAPPRPRGKRASQSFADCITRWSRLPNPRFGASTDNAAGLGPAHSAGPTARVSQYFSSPSSCSECAKQALPEIFRSPVSGYAQGDAEVRETRCCHHTQASALAEDAVGNTSPAPFAGDSVAKDRMALFWAKFDADEDNHTTLRIFSPQMQNPENDLPLAPQRHLRKQRSSAHVRIVSRRFSTLSLRSLYSSAPTNGNKLKKRHRNNPPAPLTSPSSDNIAPLPGLPKGVEQIGRGIGYRCQLPEGRLSKASICGSSGGKCARGLDTCLALLGIRKGVLSRIRAGLSRRTHRSGRKDSADGDIWDGMGRDYNGSEWSLALGVSPVTLMGPGDEDAAVLSPQATTATAINSPLSDRDATVLMTPATFVGAVMQAEEKDADTTLRLVGGRWGSAEEVSAIDDNVLSEGGLDMEPKVRYLDEEGLEVVFS